MWRCVRCTLDNPPSSVSCGACDNPRPSTPSSKKPARGSECSGCGRALGGTWTNALGKKFHPDCFVCTGCHRPFAGQTFSVKDGEPFHEACAVEIFHPDCSHCGRKIGADRSGVTHFVKVPFWGDALHAECSRRCSRCTGCNRVAKPSSCIALGDKRLVCQVCSQTALFDTSELTGLVEDVVRFYWSLGLELPLARPGSRVPTLAFPVLLVESDALNETSRGGVDTERHSHTRGLCLTESYRVIRHRMGGDVSFCSVGSPQSGGVERPDGATVTAVLVLSGLPRVVTGEILAHELMHAHIKSFRFPTNTSHVVEEGLCQLMSFLWLKAQKDSDPARLREFCLHSLENNEDEAYGEGFRQAYIHYLGMGLNRLLERVHKCGHF